MSAQKEPGSDLEQVDPVVAGLVEQEFERQSQTICLIPSENHVSRAVLTALGSVLTTSTPRAMPIAATTKVSR